MTLFNELGRRGDHLAAIDDLGQQISYAELARRADQLADEIGPSRKLILLEASSRIEWLVGYVAALRHRHPVIVSVAGDADLRTAFEKQFRPALRMSMSTGYRPEALQQPQAAALHPDLALLLSTSGSTGSMKCVRLSYQNLASNAASIAEYLRLDPSERGTVNLPTHYSYGLSIVNSHLHAGSTMLLTSRSVIDPGFWSFLQEHGATSFAGVPHVYDLLSRFDLKANAPSSLRYFTQAGGRLARNTAEKFANIAEQNGWRFYIMYGQTEATARIAYLPPERALSEPECVGIAIPGGTIELFDETGRKIEEPGAEGELVYRGPNVMMGYATTAADLVLDPGPQRLVTGDLAERSEAGLFRITGRRSRFVKIFGNRIGLDDVERLLASGGHNAIVTGIDDKLLIVTREPGDRAAIEHAVRERLKLPPAYFEVRAVGEYPLLPSGKIDYARLKASLTAAGIETESRQTDAGKNPVADAFVRVFGDAASDQTASFTSLGGDSLNYVLVAMEVERFIPQMPMDWENRSIAELSQMVSPSGGRVALPTMETNVLLRAFAICGVVAGHARLASVSGGSDLLMLLVGYNLFRFRESAMLNGDLWRNIGSYLQKIVVPAIILNLAYMLWKGRVTVSGLLLYSNFIGPDASLHIFPQWFIEVVVQSVLLLGLLLSIPTVRASLARKPFAGVLALTIGTIIICPLLLRIWDTHELYDRVPWMSLPLIIYAWLIFVSHDPRQKLITSLLLIPVVAVGGLNSRDVWVIAGALAVVWIPRVRVPALLRSATTMIAAAVFYIYMLHMTFIHVPRNVLGLQQPLLTFAVGITGPVATWWLLERLSVGTWIKSKLRNLRPDSNAVAARAINRAT